MADSQIGLMAVTAFAQGLDMFKRGVDHLYMLAADPARYLSMQLAGDGVIDFLPGVGWFAHVVRVKPVIGLAASRQIALWF